MTMSSKIQAGVRAKDPEENAGRKRPFFVFSFFVAPRQVVHGGEVRQGHCDDEVQEEFRAQAHKRTSTMYS